MKLIRSNQQRMNQENILENLQENVLENSNENTAETLQENNPDFSENEAESDG